MLMDPNELTHDLDRLEEIEKASLRLVVQAIYEYRETAVKVFRLEGDSENPRFAALFPVG